MPEPDGTTPATTRGMRRALIGVCSVLFGAGCERAIGAPEAPPPERFEPADIARYHMRLHFDQLRSIERRLVDGKLDDAKTLATLVARPETDPGMAPWAAATKEVTDLATALSKAKSTDEALRLEVRVAVACARCHQDARTEHPLFKAPGKVPRREHASSAIRMVSHQWAVDRLWEGLVGNSDPHWRAGLSVISRTPLPYSPVTDAPLLAKALQDRANQALRDADSAKLDDRARAYGEMLVTCAACHSSVKRR